ncbi:hypothetical protein MIB92_12230 [Aestuariirhabdus sp. Z084]|uniref:hypothetical protein n=1 Tax=Aestuariirhabdus haliotis TaxID=2918751 RepID=UPI00201B3FFD|nr:hypothetical protein [Aestuariirhabdus haliotis]MCL6416421.1 hypothetical protein [Aestuariirhabdus haliotis]MCL6420413.1 hypothetical protein [Aestuariirhabdus haliotis]
MSDWKNRKVCLEQNVSALKSEKSRLISEIEKLRKPKKKGFFALSLERRKLEEEAKIRSLRQRDEES